MKNFECPWHGTQKLSGWLATQDQIKNRCGICRGVVSAGIPPKFERAVLADFDQAIQDRVRTFLNSRPRGNLLILGPLGTGKTHLAAALAAEYTRMGGEPYYAPALTISNRIIAERTPAQFIDKKLLIIDEIGRQYDTQAEDLRLFELLNGRYNFMRPTVFIGNQTRKQFKVSVGAAVSDRISEDAMVITLKGASRRGNLSGSKADG